MTEFMQNVIEAFNNCVKDSIGEKHDFSVSKISRNQLKELFPRKIVIRFDINNYINYAIFSPEFASFYLDAVSEREDNNDLIDASKTILENFIGLLKLSPIFMDYLCTDSSTKILSKLPPSANDKNYSIYLLDDKQDRRLALLLNANMITDVTTLENKEKKDEDMSEILSQEEIDALLEATDEDEDENESENRNYRLHDFKRPANLKKEDRIKLSNFAKKFEEEFFRELVQVTRTNISVSFHSLDNLLYSEYTLGLTNPISFNIFKTASYPESSIIATLEPSVLIAFAKTNKNIADVTASVLAKLGIEITSIERFNDPNSYQEIKFNDNGVELLFEIISGSYSGMYTLFIPMQFIKNVLFETRVEELDSETSDNSISENLKELEVDVWVKLANTKISLEKLSNLKKEDTIFFDKSANELLEIYAGNVKLGYGEVIVDENNNYGVIIEKLERK